jgi:glutathione S-transferase
MTATLVLYDNFGSSNALKVRFLLNELGVEAERIEVPISDEPPEWYRDVHPFGTVPCLVDGDLHLRESNTILRYLAGREGRDDLYPRELRARARVDELLDALSLAVRPALWELELRTYYATNPAPPHEVAAARERLNRAMQGWEALIEPGGAATGTFSIADVAAAARMCLLAELPINLAPFPKTRQMLDATSSRPAYRAALSPGPAAVRGTS